MTVTLASLRDCFEGVVPSSIATLDAEGTPNVSFLSQVYPVDDERVALSNQFFSKTVANVRQTGRAAAMVIDARTGQQFVLDLAYETSLQAGEVFDSMAAQLRAIASQHGMAQVMALRSADVYRVTRIQPIPAPGAEQPALAMAGPAARGERLAIAARVAAGLAAESDADLMLDRTLDGLSEALGFDHAMVLTIDEDRQRLTTLASRGYSTGGAGSEVALGDGAIGIAAATLRPVRISDMSRGRRFAQAVRASAEADAERTIPLPGLAEPQSQIAVPMISRGKAAGVLFAESPSRFHFAPEDEAALSLIGAQLAASLRLAELEARKPLAAAAQPEPRQAADGRVRVRYFAHDDSLFVDDAYLIKGVPGRLLLHFLQTFVETGRRDFTNREVRLEAALRLPGVRDNLETRLILLRRRLDEKGAPMRLSRPGRGQIRLEIDGAPQLEIVAA